MEIETQGLGAGSYPEPKEEKDKTINANVYVKYTLEFDVPEEWDQERIQDYIKSEFEYFELFDREIEEIDIN